MRSSRWRTAKNLAGLGEAFYCADGCALSSVVEHYLHTVGVAGSKPAARTIFKTSILANARAVIVVPRVSRGTALFPQLPVQPRQTPASLSPIVTKTRSAIVGLVNRLPVKSSNLAAVGYDADSKTLEVEFKTGGVVQFSDVPADKAAALQSAESPGAYFHLCIRDCGFKMKKL
jgi:hypothetical protein